MRPATNALGQTPQLMWLHTVASWLAKASIDLTVLLHTDFPLVDLVEPINEFFLKKPKITLPMLLLDDPCKTAAKNLAAA